MHARQYQPEPAVASRARQHGIGSQRGQRVATRGVALSSGPARDDALPFGVEQSAYRQVADRLIAMVTDGDPNAASEAGPAGGRARLLRAQNDIDKVSRAYHSEGQRLVADLRSARRGSSSPRAWASHWDWRSWR